MNRTVVETARALLCHAGLPTKFWAEAVNAASYLPNRSTSTALQGGALRKELGTKQKLGHLKVFGCDVYSYVRISKEQAMQV